MFYIKYLLTFLFSIGANLNNCEKHYSKHSSRYRYNGGFGGALYVIMEEGHSNQSDIDAAANFAVKQDQQLNEAAGCRQKSYNIQGATVSKIVYTQDGKTALILPVLNHETGEVVFRPLDWGVLYRFNLTYVASPFTQHSYTVLHYINTSYHVFEHTFYYLPPAPQSNSLPQSDLHNPSYNRQFNPESTFEGGIHTLGVPIPVQEKGEPPPVSEWKALDRTHGERDFQSTGFIKHANVKGSITCDTDILVCHHCTCNITDRHSCWKKTASDIFLEYILNNSNTKQAYITGVFKSGSNRFQSDKLDLNEQQKAEETSNDLLGSSANRWLYIDSVRNKTVAFTVLNFNIWNVNGADYVERLQHLAAICQRAEPDVIAFQEVRFQPGIAGATWGPNQIRHLVDLLPGYQYVYQPAQVQLDHLPTMVVEGVAMLSKHSITAHGRLLLRRDLQDPADGHQRVLQHIEVQVPRVGKVHLFNTHLSLSHRARATSVLQMVPYIHAVTGPAFLMGDFNSEAHNVEVRFLDGRAELAGRRTTGLHDVWRLKHGRHSLGFTFNTQDAQLTKRIDLIFMRDHSRVSLVDVRILDDKTRGTQAASDHLALLAEFSLRS